MPSSVVDAANQGASSVPSVRSESVPPVAIPNGPLPDITDIKNGFTTSEFWVALLGTTVPVVALFTHSNLSSQQVGVIAGLAAVCSVGYSLARAWTKTAHSRAQATAATAAATQATAVAQAVAAAHDASADATARMHDAVQAVALSGVRAASEVGAATDRGVPLVQPPPEGTGPPSPDQAGAPQPDVGAHQNGLGPVQPDARLANTAQAQIADIEAQLRWQAQQMSSLAGTLLRARRAQGQAQSDGQDGPPTAPAAPAQRKSSDYGANMLIFSGLA